MSVSFFNEVARSVTLSKDVLTLVFSCFKLFSCFKILNTSLQLLRMSVARKLFKKIEGVNVSKTILLAYCVNFQMFLSEEQK